MEIVRLPKGKIILKNGDKINVLSMIVQGRVKVTFKHDSWDMEAGSIIGILESNTGHSICNYIALEDTVCYTFPYSDIEDYKLIFDGESKYTGIITMAAMHQTANLFKRCSTLYAIAEEIQKFNKEMSNQYQEIGAFFEVEADAFKINEFAKNIEISEKIETWTIDYYKSLSELSLNTLDTFTNRNSSLAIGQIMSAVYWMEKALANNNEISEYITKQKGNLCGEKNNTIFALFFKMAKKGAEQQLDIEPIREAMRKILKFVKERNLYSDNYLKKFVDLCENYNYDKVNDSEETTEEEAKLHMIIEEDKGNYLERILSYSGYAINKSEIFRKNLSEYKKLPDMLSSDDNVRKLRRALTEAFYDIYMLCFKRTMDEGYIPVSIAMFLNFGFMDEELSGKEVSDSLYDLVFQLEQCRADNVFTMYDWLISIYHGENEPSRNEFDLDYQGHLLELRKTKQINIEQEKKLNTDTMKKVEYELKNMFKSTNRATYGQISTFQPILCEHDIISSVENMIVTAEKVNEAMEHIREIDFSVFYREVAFTDLEREVPRVMIQKEVIPQVILMPNAGSKAMMWQENSGVKKDTPARIIFPIMTMSDVDDIMIEVVGRYRWEICRRIQGVRWNDITDRSLTSEFSDYIQYYRKNQQISVEVKEKIKLTLVKAKNNYREVFVNDYKNWIKFESKGSFRLNKVSRDIIFRYCPFAKSIRSDLIINPMYRDLFEKYEIINDRKKKQMMIFFDRYEKKGGEITKELEEGRNFYFL